MIQLDAHESRVLGVLVEKALTTPAQYPLTLNSIVSGCNQKSNRNPMMSLSEDQAFDALDRLRQKGLAREVMMSGSRVAKYRHCAKDVLETDTAGLVLLVELLLRGPQTLGELRSRASRMHPLESTDAVAQGLGHLQQRDEPLVRSVPPAPGSRAGRYAQLLSPELHPLDAQGASPQSASESDTVNSRVEELEAEVAALRRAVATLAKSLGQPDPLILETSEPTEHN